MGKAERLRLTELRVCWVLVITVLAPVFASAQAEASSVLRCGEKYVTLMLTGGKHSAGPFTFRKSAFGTKHRMPDV